MVVSRRAFLQGVMGLTGLAALAACGNEQIVQQPSPTAEPTPRTTTKVTPVALPSPTPTKAQSLEAITTAAGITASPTPTQVRSPTQVAK
jgi:hypothetical protein